MERRVSFLSEKGVQVLDRAFSILELLSTKKNGLGITDISKTLDLNKSTVHRIVSSLCERGYIEKTEDSNYKIGAKIVQLSSFYLNNLELNTEAKPYLLKLANELKLPVHLGILDGLHVVYIDKVDIINNIRLYSQIGKRIEAHCSALGKIILSCLSDDELLNVLKDYQFNKHTEKTIRNINELMEDLNKSRIRGYAIDDEEHDLEIRCIAAPIFDYKNRPIAAISVSGSLNTLPSSNDKEIGNMVAEIAKEISKRLCYNINRI